MSCVAGNDGAVDLDGPALGEDAADDPLTVPRARCWEPGVLPPTADWLLAMVLGGDGDRAAVVEHRRADPGPAAAAVPTQVKAGGLHRCHHQ